MEIPSEEQDVEMPTPINTSYCHIMHHQNQNNNSVFSSSSTPIPSSNGPLSSTQTTTTTTTNDHLLRHHQQQMKKIVRYRECLKNHAASMGGNATDGCGEFMPSGEEGSIEALTCSACNCHRNFHRKEVEGEDFSLSQQKILSPFDSSYYYHNHPPINKFARKLIVGHHQNHQKGKNFSGHEHSMLMRPNTNTNQMMIMSTNNMGCFNNQFSDQSDDQQEVIRAEQMVKKRFRTKFTAEQKEKMMDFAERVGWKLQRQEEGVVQSFCQEIGIKRRVLKVWMHNNKHNLAKKMMKNDNDDNNNNNNTIIIHDQSAQNQV